MPLIVRQTSRACLRDTFISRPEAIAVFSGSNASVSIEYPHFGIFISPMRKQTRKSNLYGFPYENVPLDRVNEQSSVSKVRIRSSEVYSLRIHI